MNHVTTFSSTVAVSPRIFGRLGAAAALLTFATAALLGARANAAVPGISAGTGPAVSFSLQAAETYSSQPDGNAIYSWGYGCVAQPAAFLPANVQPSAGYSGTGAPGGCKSAQLPGPTLIVTEGQTVTVTLQNNLPAVAGATSINFPGLTVSSTSGGVAGRLVQEAANGGSVTYTLTNLKPGTYAYYSGTQTDLQVEMGLFGAIVVLPSSPPASCVTGEYALAPSAYDHADTCYDREFLFQFSEIASTVHDEVLAQVQACPNAPCAPASATLEPYRPNYYLVNGRSMPDLMDANYATGYVSQPYNGNPHMHPGERLLMRVVGQGRWQHPFHFHGNHARVLGRDGHLLLSSADPASPLAGPLLFTIPTVSGQTVDAIFTWTGQGLNWDVYGNDPATQRHTCGAKTIEEAVTLRASTPTDSYFRSFGTTAENHEFCGDHGKAIPVSAPDPQIVANGQWYGGTPYIGLSGFVPTNLPPGTLQQNPGAGYAYMWHSHNEREITTNDVFPGGMMMMLIIDPVAAPVDESK
jgi:FtsP/CotA-like multicopper oxidase with cupredoxin domain